MVTSYFFADDGSVSSKDDSDQTTLLNDDSAGWIVFMRSRVAYGVKNGVSNGLKLDIPDLPEEIKLQLLLLGEQL